MRICSVSSRGCARRASACGPDSRRVGRVADRRDHGIRSVLDDHSHLDAGPAWPARDHRCGVAAADQRNERTAGWRQVAQVADRRELREAARSARRLRTGWPPRTARRVESAGRHESRIDADLRGSCDAGERAICGSASGRAARSAGVNGNPGHAQAGGERQAGLCAFRIPVHDTPACSRRARPLRSAHIRVSCSSPEARRSPRNCLRAGHVSAPTSPAPGETQGR